MEIKALDQLPMAVFIETSVINKLPFDGDLIPLTTLIKTCSEVNIPIYVSEVTVKEWIYQKKEQVRKLFDKLDGTYNTLGKYLNEKIDHKKYSVDDSLKKADETLRNFLTKNSITIIPYDLDLKAGDILDMAIEKIPPFEEKGEKGFRDHLILTSILKFSQDKKYTPILVVAKDGMFSDSVVINRFKDSGIDYFNETSFTDAESFLSTKLTEVSKEYKGIREKQLLEYLNNNFEFIKKYIDDNVHISDAFIEDRLNRKAGEDFRLVKVLGIKPVGIGKATFGALFMEEIEGRKNITFGVKLEIEIMAERSPLNFGLFVRGSKKYSVKTLEEEPTEYANDSFEPIREKRMVERELNIQASIIETDNKFTDLQINNAQS